MNKALATLRGQFGLDINRSSFRQRAFAAHRRILLDPGDCTGDTNLLIGLAIAEAHIGKSPGWIPQVQKLGCQIADFLEKNLTHSKAVL